MAVFLSNRDGGRTDQRGHASSLKHIVSNNRGGFHSSLVVSETNPRAMRVRISGLSAIVKASDEGLFFEMFQVGTDTVNLSTSHSTLNRVDSLVAYVNLNLARSTSTANNPTLVQLHIVQGAEASNASAPSDSTIQQSIGTGFPFVRLADIAVNSGIDIVRTSFITRNDSHVIDMRADWNQSSSNATDYIKNKPDVITNASLGTGLEGAVGNNELDIALALNQFPTSTATVSYTNDWVYVFDTSANRYVKVRPYRLIRPSAGNGLDVSNQGVLSVDPNEFIRMDRLAPVGNQIDYEGNTNTNVLNIIGGSFIRPSDWNTYDIMIEADVIIGTNSAPSTAPRQRVNLSLRTDGSETSVSGGADDYDFEIRAPTGDTTQANLTAVLTNRSNNNLNIRLNGKRSLGNHFIFFTNARVRYTAIRRS